MLYVLDVDEAGRIVVVNTKDNSSEVMDLDSLVSLRKRGKRVKGLSASMKFAYPVVRVGDSDSFVYVGRKVAKPAFNAVYAVGDEESYSCNKLYTGNISGSSYPDDAVLILMGNEDGVTFCSAYAYVLAVGSANRCILRIFYPDGHRDIKTKCYFGDFAYLKPQALSFVDLDTKFFSELSDSVEYWRELDEETVYRGLDSNRAGKYYETPTAVATWLRYLDKIGLSGVEIDYSEAMRKTKELQSAGEDVVWFKEGVVRPTSEVIDNFLLWFYMVTYAFSEWGFNEYYQPLEVSWDGKLFSLNSHNSVLHFLSDLFLPSDTGNLLHRGFSDHLVVNSWFESTAKVAEYVIRDKKNSISGVNFANKVPLSRAKAYMKSHVIAASICVTGKVVVCGSFSRRYRVPEYISECLKCHYRLEDSFTVWTVSGVMEMRVKELLDFYKSR